MQCTPKEIEEKRKLARLKLLCKRVKGDSSTAAVQNQEIRVNNVSTSNNIVHSPNKEFLFKPYTKTKPVLPFYGTNKVVTANFYLISEFRFAVSLSEYFTQAIEIFKTIPSKSYS